MNIRPISQTGMIADLKASADIIEEVSDTVTYFGFRKPINTNIQPDFEAFVYSIMKIESDGIVKPITTQFLWANGACAYNLQWSERANYQYLFKTF